VSTAVNDPKQARAFRFVRRAYADGVAELVYAFDDGPELVERIGLPGAPFRLDAARAQAARQALRVLHLIAGVSYYKAAVPAQLQVEGEPIDATTAAFLEQVYLNGLGEFAYRNGLDLRGRIRFPHGEAADAVAPVLGLQAHALVAIGGGKDSLVSVESLKAIGAEATAVWIGNSPLIAACAARTGLPTLNLTRELSPVLFEYNRAGAWNGHIPVTAINSAILVVAAVLYGYDGIAFSNERSASSATLEYDGQAVNHQWSKGYAFERLLHTWVHAHVAADGDAGGGVRRAQPRRGTCPPGLPRVVRLPQAGQQLDEEQGAVRLLAGLQGQRRPGVHGDLVGLLGDVETDADDGRRAVGGLDPLQQDPGDLALADEHVVGPLHPGRRVAGRAQHLRDRVAGQQRQPRPRGGGHARAQHHREREGGARRGDPGPVQAAASGGLVLGHDDVSLGGAGARPVGRHGVGGGGRVEHLDHQVRGQDGQPRGVE